MNLIAPKKDPNLLHHIKPCNNIDSSINFLKNLKFNETIIIVNECVFIDFVEEFHENLKDIYFIPKIIIFGKIR